MIDDSLAFGLDWDRDYFVNFARIYRETFWPISVFLVHPFTIYILIWKTSMNLDCKITCVIQHVSVPVVLITLIAFDFYNSFLYQIYPLAPIPVFFCTGCLCDGGIDGSTLLISLGKHISLVHIQTGLAFWTVILCVPFQVNILRTHQRMLLPGSPFKISISAQVFTIIFLTSTLISNVVGFRFWAVDTPDKVTILEKPEISWAKQYSSNFLVLGSNEGDIGNFVFELILLVTSILINFSFYIFLTHDITYRITKQLNPINSKNHRVQLRFVFNTQMIQACCSAIFFISPLMLLFVGLAVIRVRWLIPNWIVAPFRITMLLAYGSCSVPIASILLSNNPWFRKRIRVALGRRWDREQTKSSKTTQQTQMSFSKTKSSLQRETRNPTRY